MIYLNNISEANSEIRDDSLSLNFNLQIMMYLFRSKWKNRIPDE